jgi:plasmid stability protein
MLHRWSAHVRDAANGSALALHRAIRKYGAAAFLSEVIAQCASESEAKAVEVECIAAAGSLLPHGYNATAGGEGSYGMPVSAAKRAKISAALKGRTLSAECRSKISNALAGRDFSEETRARISAAVSGHTVTAETRAKLRAANAGKRHSSGARAKMSATRKGVPKGPMSAEHKAKLRAATLGNTRCAGRVLSPETRAKISARWTPERRAKLVERNRAAARIKAGL